MKSYTEREIRMADVAAAVLFGFGVLLFVGGVYRSFFGSAVMMRGGDDPRAGIALLALGGVFLALGWALNLKVRQIRRDGHREREHADEKLPDEIEETFE